MVKQSALKGRLVTCRECGKKVRSIESDTCSTRRWGINMYFCCKEHKELWVERADKELAELGEWDDLYMFVKFEVLKYKEEQNLPRYLITRLKDMRNGVVSQLSGGRLIKTKHKEGYPFPVILATFKAKFDTIDYWFTTKSFKNEKQQINYMMAIIESNINDNYNKYLADLERDNKANIEIENSLIDDRNIEIAKQHYEMQFKKEEKNKTDIIEDEMDVDRLW